MGAYQMTPADENEFEASYALVKEIGEIIGNSKASPMAVVFALGVVSASFIKACSDKEAVLRGFQKTIEVGLR